MITATLGVAGALVAVNLASIAIAWRRIKPPRDKLTTRLAKITLIRPACGWTEDYEIRTLASSFKLDYSNLEIIFCVADAADPIVPAIRALIADHPLHNATLLIGDDKFCANPKLNNMDKGWTAATGDWVIIADSNVLLPTDAVSQMILPILPPGVGLVCSPPLGAKPDGFAAELECAFLNTYQARWQFVVDQFGFGFAMGKVLAFDRDLWNAWGGIRVLASEIAEDAAATKVVRAHGRSVRLVGAPLPQLLGKRTLRAVFDRQTRWARLRRATFPATFAIELFSTVAVPLVLLASGGGLATPLIMTMATSIWYGAEMALAKAKGWHVSWRSPFACALRDALILWIYVDAWLRDDFVWRGNKMSVGTV
jgi:ceramide glucosyltransferase